MILGVSGAAVVLIGCVAIGAYFVFSGADDPIEVATTDFGTRSDDGPAASEAVEGDGRAEPATTSTEAASEAPEVSASNAAPAEPGGEDASPTAAESASAILELRSLGVRFEYVEEYGGRLADFGLILGDFDNEKLRLLHVMPDQDPVVAVRLPPAVTDDALDHVIGLERVTVLAILGDNVTGEGLRKLTQMTWLKQLIVWSNQVTQNDIDELKGSLPDCEIRLLRP